MHAAPGLIALNDKVTFWLQLQKHGLSHLHPHSVLLQVFLSSGWQTEGLDSPLWFLKYRYGDNGRSVWCFTSLDLLDQFARKSSMDKIPDRFLVQAGIQPLLLDGKKLVLRVFALVIGERIYVHREFLIKVMSDQYSEDTIDRHTHVDCCAGEKGVSIIRGSEWSEYETWMPKITMASKQVLATYTNVLEPEPELDGCRFSLIGLDVLITSAGQLIMLEANCPPSLFEVLDDVAKAVKVEVQEDFYRFVRVGN
jgi:hypothetical protein